MRIKRLRIPAIVAEAVGLQATDLRLGRVVTLVGPNGSGKTRLLALVSKLASERGRLTEVAQITPALQGLQAQLNQLPTEDARRAGVETRLRRLQDELELANAIELDESGVRAFTPLMASPANVDLGDMQQLVAGRRQLLAAEFPRIGLGKEQDGGYAMAYLANVVER